jgi:hypothetical protein
VLCARCTPLRRVNRIYGLETLRRSFCARHPCVMHMSKPSLWSKMGIGRLLSSNLEAISLLARCCQQWVVVLSSYVVCEPARPMYLLRKLMPPWSYRRRETNVSSTSGAKVTTPWGKISSDRELPASSGSCIAFMSYNLTCLVRQP